MGIGITVWTLAWAALILAVAKEKIRFAGEKPGVIEKGLLYIAAVSYPLYLLHQFIGFAIIRKMELAGLTAQGWIVIPVAISLVLAAMVHYWVELPAAKVLLRFEKKLVLPRKGGNTERCV